MWAKLYARKSRELGDSEHLDLMAHQIEPLLRIAASDGFALAQGDIITEVGSGETMKQRPRFRSTLHEVEALPFRAGGRLYVSEESRISRGTLIEVGQIVQILQRAAVNVRVPHRVYDLTQRRDETDFARAALESREELNRYKDRIQAAYERDLRRGRIRNGAAPFGYEWSKDAETLVVVPGQFALLQRCCEEVLGVSVLQLAAKYGLCPGRLTNVLRNPLICGWPARIKVPYPPGHPKAGLYRRLPRAEWIWPERVNESYPHACTRERFELIQQALGDRFTRKAKTGGEAGWCRDVVRFIDGPQTARLSSVHVHGQRHQLTYEAPRYFHHDYIDRVRVHEEALLTLSEVFAGPARLASAAAAYRERQRLLQPDAAAEQESLPRRLAQARRRYQEAVDAEWDAETATLRVALHERRVRLERETERLERELAAAQAQVIRHDRTATALEQAAQVIDGFSDAWPLLTEPQKRALANAVIQAIDVICVPGGRSWRREVVGVRLQPWFMPLSQSPSQS